MFPAVPQPAGGGGFFRLCIAALLTAFVGYAALQMKSQLFRPEARFAGPAREVRSTARRLARLAPPEPAPEPRFETAPPVEEESMPLPAVEEIPAATAPAPREAWRPASAPARPVRTVEERARPTVPPPTLEPVPPRPLQAVRLPPLPPLLLQQARGKEVVVLFAVDRAGRASFDSIESSAGLSTDLCKLLSRGALTVDWEPARDETGRVVHGIARVVVRP